MPRPGWYSSNPRLPPDLHPLPSDLFPLACDSAGAALRKGHQGLAPESSGFMSASLVDSSWIQLEFLPFFPPLLPPLFCWLRMEHESGLNPLHCFHRTWNKIQASWTDPRPCTLSSWEPCRHIPVRPALGPSDVLELLLAWSCFPSWFPLPGELFLLASLACSSSSCRP